jgi:hypothetical protein
MSDERATDLIERGDTLFAARPRLLSFWQEAASMFYPERADFTVDRLIGDTFADWLMTSYPIIARRDLGNTFSALLRPTDKWWFEMGTMRPEREDRSAKAWFDYARDVQRRAMYSRPAQFVRATKEGDHDFATFGQAVLTAETNRNGDDLLYRSWHLRDVVWCENAEGKIDEVHRKWKPYARDLCAMFPKTAGIKLKEIADKTPYEQIECRHVVVSADDYDPPTGQKPPKTPYVSIYLNMQDNEFLEEKPIYNPMYIIPRWETVSGSQYAYSPATVAALPDARLIQAMTLTLLEAGERFTSPPMIAVQEAIRGDVQLYAGGITWVDAEYDERLGEVLRPLTQDKSGMPLGRDLRNDVKESLAEAFFLNKLNLPMGTDDKEMTAFETGQRVQEYIRQTLPLFEPVETDYNGGICEVTFDLLMRGGAFGSYRDIPQSIRGQDIQFKFISPLSEAIEMQKAGKLGVAKQIIATTADLDPTVPTILDAQKATRDALTASGVPAAWQRSGRDVSMIAQYKARLQQSMQALAAMQASANTVKTMGDAGQSVNAALTPQQPQPQAAA